MGGLLSCSTVSIHAPRVGCDRWGHQSDLLGWRFNSRTPCGVRQTIDEAGVFDAWFQFTHPVWGATVGVSAAFLINDWFQFTHPVWGATKDT